MKDFLPSLFLISLVVSGNAVGQESRWLEPLARPIFVHGLLVVIATGFILPSSLVIVSTILSGTEARCSRRILC